MTKHSNKTTSREISLNLPITDGCRVVSDSFTSAKLPDDLVVGLLLVSSVMIVRVI